MTRKIPPKILNGKVFVSLEPHCNIVVILYLFSSNHSCVGILQTGSALVQYPTFINIQGAGHRRPENENTKLSRFVFGKINNQIGKAEH